MTNQQAVLSADEIQAETRALRRRKRASLLLVVPLLVFIFFAFVAPIATMLYRSVYNPTLVELIPKTVQELSGWKQTELPDPVVFSSFAKELKQLAETRQSGVLAAAINRAYPGASSLVNSTARKFRKLPDDTLIKDGMTLL